MHRQYPQTEPKKDMAALHSDPSIVACRMRPVSAPTVPPDPDVTSAYFPVSSGSLLRIGIPYTHLNNSSYPSSPINTHQNGFGTSHSYPVLPSSAQQSRYGGGGGRKTMEATLVSKKNGVNEGGSSSKPKLHLYAQKNAPKCTLKEEEFPSPPIEWLLGGSTPSDGSSVSVSDALSGDSTEDEFSSATPPDLEDPHPMLSLGLKSLLKVQA
ncbi:hypothetical protein RvY_19105 [Ramazzottius varieornatus]|uniref:Uncharacterized protein n=1 Tax=Ramazzottius varieornatus TaxID=947166 RepID=A0A1D1WC26_RAMVA|nr:hypothetical protein RvY_19105 [Ramazzottius varieornatus]